MEVYIMELTGSAINTSDMKNIVNELNTWCMNYRGFVNQIFSNQTTMEEKVTQLFWIVKHVCESQVDVMEHYNSLYQYVVNYFKNLNLQEEVNKKINDMFETGELAQIILFDKLNIVDTTENMIDNTNLVNGVSVLTLGYYSVGDGGGGLFHISESAEGINLKIGSLYANLIYDKKINIKQLGAKTDADITELLQSCVNGVVEDTEIIIEPEKYFVTGPIELNKRVKINGVVNKNKNTENVIPEVYNIKNNANLNYIFYVSSSNVEICNITLIGGTNYGIKISSIRNTVENCFFYGFSIGIEYVKSEETWIGENVVKENIFSYCVVGVKSTRNSNGALMDSYFLYNIFSRCENSFNFDSTISMEFTGNHDYSTNGAILSSCRNTIINDNYFDCGTNTCLVMSILGSLIITNNRFLISGDSGTSVELIKVTSISSSRLSVDSNSVFYDGDYTGLFLHLLGTYIITTYLKNNIVYDLELVKSEFDERNIHGNIKSGKITGDLGYTTNLCYLDGDYISYYINCYGTINPGDIIGVSELGGGIVANTVSAVGKYVIDSDTHVIPCTLYVQSNGTIQLSSDTEHVLNTLIANFSLKYAY